MRAKSVQELVLNYINNYTKSLNDPYYEMFNMAKAQITADSKWDLVMGVPSFKRSGKITGTTDNAFFIDNVVYQIYGDETFITYFDEDTTFKKVNFFYEFQNIVDLDNKEEFPTPETYKWIIGDFNKYKRDDKKKTTDELKDILKKYCPNYKLVHRLGTLNNNNTHLRPFRLIDSKGLEPVIGVYLKVYGITNNFYFNLFTNLPSHFDKLGPVYYLSATNNFASVKREVPYVNKPIAYKAQYSIDNSIASFVDLENEPLKGYDIDNSIYIINDEGKYIDAWTIIDMDEARYVIKDLLGFKIRGEVPPKPPTPPEPIIPEDKPVITIPGQSQNGIHNKPGTGDKTSDTIVYEPNSIGGAGWGTTTYIVSPRQLGYVKEKVFAPDIFDSFFAAPESILNLSLWPIDFNKGKTDKAGMQATNTLKIGKQNLPLTMMSGTPAQQIAYYMLPTFYPKLDVTSKPYELKEYFGSFLDYEPYTKIYLYAPYVGTVSLNPNDVQNQAISIYYIFDYVTGKAQLKVLSSTGAMYSFDCILPVTIPFTYTTMSSLTQNIFLGALNTSTAAAASGPLGAITTGVQSLSTAYKSFDYKTSGSQGDTLGRFDPQKIYLIIDRPVTAVPDNYNKIKGRPSEITITLSKLKGYTQIDKPYLDVNCSTTEREMIYSKLQEGVYIR